jgi:hypothetical protein
LDAACEGDPVEWAARHHELTAVACEQIRFWAEQRPTDQILEVFHQESGPPAGVSDVSGSLPRLSAETPEYCETIDGLIGEAAAIEMIRCLDHEATVRHLGSQYEALVDRAVEQFPAFSEGKDASG